MKTWDLEDARSRFGELARRALAHRPQRVTLGDREAVVVVSAADYAALTFARDLVDFIRRSVSPPGGSETEFERPTARDAPDAPGTMGDA